MRFFYYERTSFVFVLSRLDIALMNEWWILLANILVKRGKKPDPARPGFLTIFLFSQKIYFHPPKSQKNEISLFFFSVNALISRLLPYDYYSQVILCSLKEKKNLIRMEIVRKLEEGVLEGGGDEESNQFYLFFFFPRLRLKNRKAFGMQ